MLCCIIQRTQRKWLAEVCSKDPLRKKSEAAKEPLCMQEAMGDKQPPQPLWLLTLCSVSRLLLLGSSKAGHLHTCCLCEGHGRDNNECFCQQCWCGHHCDGEPVESSLHHLHQRKLHPGPPRQHHQGWVLDHTPWTSPCATLLSPHRCSPAFNTRRTLTPPRYFFNMASFGNDS